MASLFVRIRELVTAQAHHQIDQAENPQVMAQQVLRDLGEDLSQANRALVAALGAEKLLQRSREQAAQEAADWEGKAERLLTSGQEALARGALEKALAARAQVDAQERPLATARHSSQRMREQVDQLKREWGSARGRCAQIAANQSAAAALGAASRATDQYGKAMQRAQRLDQLSRRAEVMDCETEAAAELLSERDRFEREVAKVDQSAAVDAAMSALKQRMAAAGAGSPA